MTSHASQPSSGRLTLSWVDKHQALLRTPADGYQWVSRDDPRVTEVRLLHEEDTVGEVSGATPASGNLLIVGDSYDALHSLTRIPEYASEYRGRAAAEEWARFVNDDGRFGTWRYLFCSETALRNSHGGWDSLLIAAGAA